MSSSNGPTRGQMIWANYFLWIIAINQAMQIFERITS